MKTYKSLRALFAALICLFLMLVSVSAQPTITVGRALGPNAFGSQAAWAQNVYAAFASGQPSLSVGSSNLPTSYEEAPEMISIYSIASSQNFGMWDGTLLTVANLGAAFSSQTGNNIFFPVLVNGNGVSVSLSQFGRSLQATNPGGTSSLQLQGIPSAYTSTNIGILFGTDHAFGGTGTAADTFIMSGASSQAVDAFFSIGLSARLFVPGGTSGSATATILANQGLVDNIMNANDDLASITAFYALGGSWGIIEAQAAQQFGMVAIPELGTYAAWAGIASLAFAVYQRRKLVAV